MAAIDDASRLLDKTCSQIDKMIDQIETDFKDYLDVVPECKEDSEAFASPAPHSA